MRWVILTDDYPPCAGGVASWTAAVAAGLHAAGHGVLVICRARPGLPERDGEIELVGVRGPRFGGWGPLWLARAARARLRPGDRILCTTWPLAGPWVGGAWPVDVVVHGSDLTFPRPGRAEVLRAANRVWSPSAYLATVAAQEGVQARLLPAPVDVLPAGPRPVALRRLAMVARATPLKAADRFFGLLRASGLEGVLIGAGPELSEWRAEAGRLGLRARFTGHLPRAALLGVLRQCQACVLLPRSDEDGHGAEGFGLALVEAAAAGVPGVGCPTGGVPEALGPGLLLPEPDDSTASWTTLRRWWRPERGEEARAWVAERHGRARCVAALLE